ncbi:hypothetical protein K3181_12060 [Qipengyuania sp. YG27]|uniref:Tyrosine kinase G-rich domain-containing protein n=1 Tax=Qipengyuania mesophila TaxID=2867246 RepID=A0ABS7JWY8_9SPHN|nr:hypothetical protein [Qipengyuania mesophila]MBX7502177.1 hypothetical protein [Qipengyuania mesophila]
MTYLEDLWRRLFSKEITTLEHEVMKGVSAQFGRDASVTMLAAILVRMLFLVLIEHKASPFTVLRGFARAMEENRQKTVLISETYEALYRDLVSLRGDVNAARLALNDARDLAHAKVGYDPLLGFRPAEQTGPAREQSQVPIALLIGGCFAGAFLGCIIAFLVLRG